MMSSACCRTVLRLGMALAFLMAASGPVAAQDQQPLRDARSIVDVVPVGYQQVASSTYLDLFMELDTGQFAVRDRRSGAVWLSSPTLPPTEIISEGMRQTYGSVFLVYTTRESGVSASQEPSVGRAPEIQVELTDHGASVRYDMEKLSVSLVVRYTLGSDYLDVAIDEASLVESPNKLLVAIDLLPFLGATPHEADTPAYFVLPDGPGALAHVGGKQPGYKLQFSMASYGSETYSFAQPSEQRTPLATVGIARPEFGAAVLGVATAGAGDFSIEALRAGAPLSFSRANLRLVYRRVTQYPRGISSFREYYQSDRVKGDRAARYFFLAGESADWVGMAQRLRLHLMEDRGVPRLSGRASEPAMRLRLVMGAEKPGLFGRRFVTATTFDEAAEIVAVYQDAGLENLDVVLVGWQNDGYEGNLPKRWPPDGHLGGAGGLKRLADAIHARGGRLLLEDDYTLAFLRNGGFFPLTDAVIHTNLLPVNDLVTGSADEVPTELRRYRFLLNPDFTMKRYLRRDAPRLAELGADGLELRWAGELVLRDVSSDRPMERTDFVDAWRRLLRFAAGTMSEVAVQGGNEYVLGIAESITQLPLRPTNQVFADQAVPFYPIATHGLARLHGEPTYMDREPTRDVLRRLEYGMLPVYELTYRDPIVLARSSYPELYSSHYLDWLDRATAEYRVAVAQLGHTVGQFIVGHRQLAPQVFETRYEDGTRVVVNYGDQAYEGGGVRVAGLGHLVVRD